ncbi:MAG TPA: RNA 2',3'-cyclic phosphodiesterase [Geobacteraceae bacterium]
MSLHRLFVAIDLPEETRNEVDHLREALPGARWVPTDQLHLTLRFLGEVDEATLRSVQAGLATVQAEPFTLQVRGVGHFPPRRPPRVLWVGLDGGTHLIDLQRQIETVVQATGLPAEERAFSPHITLARFREAAAAPVLAFEERQRAFACPPFSVVAFQLYESTLTSSGAIHRVLTAYPLEHASPAAD